jgi:hypothetical protein
MKKIQMTNTPQLQAYCEIHQAQPPRVGTVPNWSVQRGPIALPNLLCAPSASHKSFVRAIGQLTCS